jgi:hypothetical protein
LRSVRDRETSMSRRFGIVEFRSGDDAARGREPLDGQWLKEYSGPGVVNEARDRRDG